MNAAIRNLADRWSPGQRKVALFVLFSFLCLGLPRVVTNASAFALFLDTFDASLLPWTYLGAAVVAPAVGAAYLWLQRRLSLWSLLLVSLWFDVAVLAVVRGGLGGEYARVFVVAVTIWVEAEWLIAGLVFWGLAERMFDIRESKRLFGIIGSGEPVAVIVGGLLVSLLLRVIPIQDLLLVSMAAMAGSSGLVLAIRGSFAGDLHQDGEEETDDGRAPRFGRYAGYAGLLFALTFVAEVAHFIADNAFYGVAEHRFTDAAALGSFIALFFAASGLLSLAFGLAASAWLMRRFGVGAAILSLPLLVGAAALVATAGSAGSTWMLVAVCLAKLFDEAVRNGIYSAGFLTLFQPLPPELRTRAHAISGSYFEQAAAGVAGVALLGLNFALGFSPLVLVVSLAIVCVAWLGLGVAQVRGYRAVLSLAFADRRLGDGPDLGEPATLDAIERRLLDGRPGETVYAMTLLAREAPERLAPALPGLLRHADDHVRGEALSIAGRCGGAGVRALVSERVRDDPSSKVRGEALRALAALDGAAAIDDIAPYLDDEDASVRSAAYVALLRDAGIEGLLEAGPRLLALLRAPRAESNRFAAGILEELGSPQFYRLLGECLANEDVDVRRTALRTAMQVPIPALKGQLVPLLRSAQLGQGAVLALAPIGEPALVDAFALTADPASDGPARVRIAELAGRVGGSRAVQYLLDRLLQGDLDERAAVAAALEAIGFAASGTDRERVWRAVDSTLVDLQALAVEPAGEGAIAALMRSSLRDAYERQCVRLLQLLGTLLPAQVARTALARWRYGTPGERAYAIELVDTRLPAERRAAIGAALTGDTRAIEVSALARRLQRPDHPATPWLRTLAAAIETAADLRPAGLSSHLAIDPKNGTAMLLIEKVILLRAVPIFEQVPDRLLADVAGRLVEMEVAPQQVLMREGDVGDSLYIVVDGRFAVARGERALAELGEGEVIGELALLDPGPRSATVTAITAARVLALGPRDFDDLVAGSKEIALGFVRNLSRRLRLTSEKLSSAAT